VPRVTLQDLADELALSKATVSLALRGDPRTADATRARVQALARRRGYRPDPALSAIARERWRGRRGSGAALGWIFRSAAERRHDAEQMRREAARRARALGWRLRDVTLSEHASPAALAAVLLERGIQAAVVASLEHAGQMAGWPWERFTMVGCGQGRWLPPVDRIHRDVVGAGLLACRRLRAAGRRRIAAVPAGDPGTELGSHSRAGLLAGLAEVGNTLPLCPVAEEDIAGIGRWLRRQRPDALLLPHLGSHRRLASAGLLRPGLPVALLKRSPALRAPGIDPQHEACGALAVDQLLGLWTRHQRGLPLQARDHLLPARWVE